MSKKKFNKAPLSYQGQLETWKDRGLNVADEQRAIRYLSNISYYRLSAYAIPFQKEKDTFNSDVDFNDILSLYIFDRELRLLVLDAIERIEVAVRTKLINHLSMKYGSHWHEDKSIYKAPYFDSNGKKIETFKFIKNYLKKQYKPENREVFIEHYFNHYDDPKNPPSWMAIELITIGSLSRLYNDLEHNTDKAAIANEFGIHFTVFESWLHALTYCRNICAHHSRFWNRNFQIQPKPAKKTKYPFVSSEFQINNRSFYYIHIMKYFLNVIIPKNSFGIKLTQLFDKYKDIPIQYMGLPTDPKTKEVLNWKNENLWKH